MPETRAEQVEAALTRAEDAVAALIAARDETVAALAALAQTFAAGDDTYEQLKGQPFTDVGSLYGPETVSAWLTIDYLRDYIARDGDGSCFTFDHVAGDGLSEVSGAVRAWLARFGTEARAG